MLQRVSQTFELVIEKSVQLRRIIHPTPETRTTVNEQSGLEYFFKHLLPGLGLHAKIILTHRADNSTLTHCIDTSNLACAITTHPAIRDSDNIRRFSEADASWKKIRVASPPVPVVLHLKVGPLFLEPSEDARDLLFSGRYSTSFYTTIWRFDGTSATLGDF